MKKIKKPKETCPNCYTPLKVAGKIKVSTPTGDKRQITIRYCTLCGWRGI